MIVYNEKKNPEGAHIPGVPLNDLSEVQFNELPKHIQASVLAAPFYSKKRQQKEITPVAEKPEGESKK